MRRKFISSALVAVLILSIASLTVIAATLGWHHKLIEYFNNPTTEQMELMNGAFDAPVASKSDNGYTVNVLNTLADKHGIYVLYELVLPADKELSELTVEEYMQDITHSVLVKQKEIMANNNAMMMGVGSHRILDVDKNKITLCDYTGTSSEIVGDSMINLTVRHNKYVDEDVSTFVDGEQIQTHYPTTSKKIVKGDFEIDVSWNFKYKDVGKSVVVNKKLDINGVNDNTLNQIDISPISVWIIAEGDAIPTAMRPVIKFTDGTEITYDSRDREAYAMFSNYQTGDNSKGYSTLGYVFDEITDIKTIESITIGDQIIKVN